MGDDACAGAEWVQGYNVVLSIALLKDTTCLRRCLRPIVEVSRINLRALGKKSPLLVELEKNAGNNSDEGRIRAERATRVMFGPVALCCYFVFHLGWERCNWSIGTYNLRLVNYCEVQGPTLPQCDHLP